VAAEVMKLKRQVARLTKVAINRIQYSQAANFQLATALGLDSYVAHPLLKFDNWSRVFGTDADDEVNKQCVIKSQKCNWRFVTFEPDARQYSIFVVSLKDNGSELLNDVASGSPGTLATLTPGTHYTSSADQTLLNLNYFNIHYHKKFTAGVVNMSKVASGTAGALQNIPNNGIDTLRLGSWNLKFGLRGMQVKNPSGDWRAGIYPKDPSKNYFALTFWAGDSIADLEVPYLSFQTLTQVDVSG